MTDNHSAPPDVTGLSERSVHAERPQVASVRGLPRGYTHTSAMETADGESPKAPACCQPRQQSIFLSHMSLSCKKEVKSCHLSTELSTLLHPEVQTV